MAICIEPMKTAELVAEANNELVTLKSHDGMRSFSLPLDVLPDLLNFLEEVMDMGRRKEFRVPLANLNASATVTVNGATYPAIPRDISLSGFGFIRDHSMPDVARETDISIQLKYATFDLKLDGRVVFLKEDRIGVWFPGSFVAGELSPPEPLRQLVSQAQREFVRNLRSEE